MPAYATAARERIAAIEPLRPELIAAAPSRRAEPRIPFLSVIEAGHVRPGEMLRCASGHRRALVRADATLQLGPAIGSIHKIGALAQGLPACNGWTFWHAERGRGAGRDRHVPDRHARGRARLTRLTRLAIGRIAA